MPEHERLLPQLVSARSSSALQGQEATKGIERTLRFIIIHTGSPHEESHALHGKIVSSM